MIRSKTDKLSDKAETQDLPGDWEEVPCLACGSEESFIWKTVTDDYNPNRKVSLVRCAACDLVFTNPRPSEQAMGKYYPEDYICNNLGISPNGTDKSLRDKFFDHFFVVDREMKKVAQLKKILGKLGAQKRIMDIGCGRGGFLRELRQRFGCDVVGVEPSNECTQLHDGQFTIYDSVPAKQEVGQFDAITLWYVFEHIHEPRRLLDQCRRLLKPSGKLLIEVPNHAGWPARIAGNLWAGYDPPRHTVHFTPKTAVSLLERADWRVLSVSYPVQAVNSAFAIGKLLGRPWLTRPRDCCFQLGATFGLLMPVSFVLSLLKVNDAILVVAESA